MKVLFSALHHAYFRNFESVVRELAARGHHVHLTADEPEGLGGRELVERLAAEFDGRVTWDLSPSLDGEPWFDAARRLRSGMDYARMLEPRYASSPKLRMRAKERAPRVVRWAASVPAIGPRVAQAALKRVERLLPRSDAIIEYLRAQAPDLVVLVSLTYSRSQQLDMLKAARVLRLPVAAAIMSWDHLSSKALLHLAPDLTIVWNDVQRREAIEMHGLPSERIAITGAQCYDQWFTRQPARDRETFCRAMGLRADRPFVLWVHSALSPTPQPPEPELVVRWLERLRGSADPRLRDIGVLVRPHPERLKEWNGVSLDRFDNVAFHGRNPIDAVAKDDYFDSLYHSAAVIGLVTSAFLEAAIVGRPVLTFTLPEYRIHQEAMIHFQYLMTVEGGLLHTAADIDAHLEQLAEAVATGQVREDRNRRFISAFVRPQGIDVAATPVFVDAIERLAREGTTPDPTLDRFAWMQPAITSLAARTRTGFGRWLLLDERGDAWDSDRERKQSAFDARERAKAQYQREKLEDRERQVRREARIRQRKEVKSAFRRVRHRTAVTLYRALAMAGLWRGDLPGAGKQP